MISEETLARINELARKQKSVGLTAEEKEEQSVLRGQYIAAIRANLRSQLDQIDVVDPDGSVHSLAKKD